MPILDFLGKSDVVQHHKHVPVRLLHEEPSLSFAAENAEQPHILVEGDNLVALRALLPRYGGQVKCIYIDPPYNTGNEGWAYNDNVKALQIQAWLNSTVGRDDLSRHDKWLCMMYPRLTLLREFLRTDGVIFISIDDNEVHHLRCIMDEIFGAENFVGMVIWKNVTDNNPTRVATEHEYVICYAKIKDFVSPVWKSSRDFTKEILLEKEQDLLSKHKNPTELQNEYTGWIRDYKLFLGALADYKFIDSGGIYAGSRSVHNPGKEGYRYDVFHPKTGKPCKQPLMGYRFPEKTMREIEAQGRILFGEDENKIIELKVYAKDYVSKLSSVFELDGRAGTNEFKSIFAEKPQAFDYPKTTPLLENLLSFVTANDDLILDSFAGSGTTAHAVMQLNREDGGARRAILVEMEPTIAQNITSERLRRVAGGYTDAKGKQVEGLGGGFRYLRLGAELFEEHGNIAPDVRFSELAQYVFFYETGVPLSLLPTPLPKSGAGQENTPLLGVASGKAVYLLYNGILKDKTPHGGNVLTRETLGFLAMPPLGKAEEPPERVVYGTSCRLSPQTLAAEGMVFKQIPYSLHV